MIRKVHPYYWLMVFLFIVLLVWNSGAIGSFMNRSQANSIEAIKKSLMKACIQCYALEGSYPESLKYLSDNYGIQLDEEKYFYYYEIFASNMSPIIDVILRGRDL